MIWLNNVRFIVSFDLVSSSVVISAICVAFVYVLALCLALYSLTTSDEWSLGVTITCNHLYDLSSCHAARLATAGQGAWPGSEWFWWAATSPPDGEGEARREADSSTSAARASKWWGWNHWSAWSGGDCDSPLTVNVCLAERCVGPVQVWGDQEVESGRGSTTGGETRELLLFVWWWWR